MPAKELDLSVNITSQSTDYLYPKEGQHLADLYQLPQTQQQNQEEIWFITVDLGAL